MQDPLITLYSLFKTDWALTGALAKANITFSTGGYSQDVAGPFQVTFTHIWDDPRVQDLGQSNIRIEALYQIDCWCKVQAETSKGPGLAKGYIWSMREEVYRLIKANHDSMTGIQVALLNEPGRRLDEPDMNPPLLRWQQDVELQYSI